MINIKRRKKLIIVGLVLGSLIISFLICTTMYIEKVYYNKVQAVDALDDDKKTLLSTQKEKELKQFAAQIVDEYSVEGHAMVVVESNILAHDKHKRYLLEIDTVAISREKSTGAYTYYIVVQEDDKNEHYILPFGVERVEKTGDQLKREIMISMMKVVNGWGSSKSEFEARWNKALLLPSSRMQIIRDKKENTKLDMEEIYYTQGILKYISTYLANYQKAIELSNAIYIQPYLRIAKEYYKQQYQEIEALENKGISREVIDLEILGITLPSEDRKCLVMVQIDMCTYLPDDILNSSEIITYQVGIMNEEIKILEVLEVDEKN